MSCCHLYRLAITCLNLYSQVVGYILARKGILSGTVRKSINRLNVAIFTPSLLFSKVAFSLTREKLADLWIVPLGFVLVTVVSMSVAFVMAKVFRLKRSQMAFAVACAGFPNSNCEANDVCSVWLALKSRLSALPIALVQSLVISLTDLKWGKDDHKDQMLGRALVRVLPTLSLLDKLTFEAATVLPRSLLYARHCPPLVGRRQATLPSRRTRQPTSNDLTHQHTRAHHVASNPSRSPYAVVRQRASFSYYSVFVQLRRRSYTTSETSTVKEIGRLQLVPQYAALGHSRWFKAYFSGRRVR